MIPQLISISISYKILQRSLITCNLGSDDKEGRSRAVFFQNSHSLIGVLRRPVVNSEHDDYVGGGNVLEDIGPPMLTVAEQKPRWFIHEPPRRDQSAVHYTQKNGHYRHAHSTST